MGFHTFDSAKANQLEDVSRFRFCSREELLEHLPRGPESTVVDLGSGTGFYTSEIAPFVGQVFAVDLQPEMHRVHRDSGVADGVSLVLGDAESLPLAEGSVDGAFSTMTFHEATTDTSLAALARVLAPESPFVVVDWSAEGNGDAGPPREERFSAARAGELLSAAGFTVETARERSETFKIVAHR